MNDRGTIVNGDTVRFQRMLPGPIERVWAYLTEGPLLTTWLAEDGAIPQRAGESFVLRMGGGDDMPERDGYEAAMYGTVLTYDPPHLLDTRGASRHPTDRCSIRPCASNCARTLRASS